MANEPPALEPDPIPNIVLHPGDALAVYASPLTDDPVTVRLYDRDGRCYAILDCDLTAPDLFRIEAIRFVDTIARR